MKKFDNFVGSLEVLGGADFSLAEQDEIYRMGVIGQFNLTFELAWKALQAVMQLHSLAEAQTGSPREILKMAYKVGFLEDADVWLLMLQKRNMAIHVYKEEDAEDLAVLIRRRFLPAFHALEQSLREKLEEAEESSWED